MGMRYKGITLIYSRIRKSAKKNITRTHAVICKKNLGMVCSKRFKSEVQIRRRAESRGFETEGDATESLEHVLPG